MWIRLLTFCSVMCAFACGCGDTTETIFCTYHSDCPEEGPAYCIDGVCLDVQCREDRDCASAEVCDEGACVSG